MLRQAIESYDQAIGLRKELPLGIDQYRIGLAGAYMNRGYALQTLGTVGNLRQAIESYDQAIDLMKELPLAVDEYRNDLALAYTNRSGAQTTLGTPEMLRQAIDSCDEAIGLMKELPLAVDQYRQDLATAYLNRGNAQQTLGTTGTLRQAIDSYDEAIGLMKELPLDVDKNSYWLACTYMNRGHAQMTIGTPEMLRQAIESCNEAIGLMKELPLAVDEYRHGLATAYLNRGNAQSTQGTEESLLQAIDSYKLSLQTSSPLNSLVWQYAETKAKALKGMAETQLAIGTEEMCIEANDAAEEGIEILTNLEIHGIFTLRSLRESLFRTALATFRETTPQFIPEFLLEHLDPLHPGAAPQSEAMHLDALKALRFCYVWAGPGKKEVQEEVVATARRLTEIKRTYYTGSSQGARLSAWYHEHYADDLVQAEQTLRQYTEVCPSDPAGFQQLAAFYYRHGKSGQAVESCEHGLAALARSLPGTASLAILDQWAEVYRSTVDQGAAFLFGEWPGHNGQQEVAEVSHRFGAINSWIGKREGQLAEQHRQSRLPEAFLARVTKGLQEISTGYLERHNEWLRLDREQVFEEFSKNWEEARKGREEKLFRLLGSGLRQAWGLVGERFVNALRDVWQQLDEIPQEATEEHREERQEEIYAGLARRTAELSNELIDAKIEKTAEGLKESLGPLWDGLLEEEQKLLAVAGSFIAGPPSDSKTLFAGLNLGLAVETSLDRRIFSALQRNLLSVEGIELAPESEEAFLQPVILYLTSRRSHLMLNQMKTAMCRAVERHSQGVGRPLDLLLGQVLSSLPDAARILVKDPVARKRRRDFLDLILAVRNSCAHPSQPPSEGDLQRAWRGAVEDQADGFYHYFIAAHIGQEMTPGVGLD